MACPETLIHMKSNRRRYQVVRIREHYADAVDVPLMLVPLKYPTRSSGQGQASNLHITVDLALHLIPYLRAYYSLSLFCLFIAVHIKQAIHRRTLFPAIQ